MKPELVANMHCECGENPLWDAEQKRVLWCDIPPGRIYEYKPATGEQRCIYDGDTVGGFTIQCDGTLLLFQSNFIARLDADGNHQVLIENIDADMVRFNDVIADPEGRVYAGTIGKDAQRGGLYRVERDGSIKRLFQGTGCSNGMGFSPDRRLFYWTCSTTRRIFRFAYDPKSGELTERSLWATISKEAGVPDGMTVDRDGNIWSAHWDGFGVYQHTPDGKILQKIELPVGKVSSAIFGGENLDDLYITTAGGSEGSETQDGALFRIRGLSSGPMEFCSQILLDGS